jgi:uncharacterized SAM-binding protein YcdF (DUF218 family)
MKKKVIFLVCSIILVLASLLIFYGPSFLTCQDEPVKSDVIILFSGVEQKTRELEAEKLLREGYGRHIIVPAYGEVQQVVSDGLMKRNPLETKEGNLLFQTHKSIYYKKYYEETHIEALEAKRMMDKSGFRSAILVSSPYHMRRIRMIADEVFGYEKYKLYCVPTSFEKSCVAADWLDKNSIAIFMSEYVKIGWFLLYTVFW